MYGTLRRALDARGIEITPEDYNAEVEGRIEGIGRTIRITNINVHYEFPVPSGQARGGGPRSQGASAGLPCARKREGRHRDHLDGGYTRSVRESTPILAFPDQGGRGLLHTPVSSPSW